MNISITGKHHLILFGILKDFVIREIFYTFYVFITDFSSYFSLQWTQYSQGGLTELSYHPGFLLIS